MSVETGRQPGWRPRRPAGSPDIHAIDISAAVPVRHEQEPATLGPPHRTDVERVAVGDGHRLAPRSPDEVDGARCDIADVAEGEFLVVRDEGDPFAVG